VDPDATLAAFRSAIQRWQEAAVADSFDAKYSAALDALDAAVSLDRWLSRGGFPPTAWQPHQAVPPIPTTSDDPS
jgi:hypothetical protein